MKTVNLMTAIIMFLSSVSGSAERIVFVPDVENVTEVTVEQMETAKTVVRARLNGMALTEAEVKVNEKEIVVLMPDGSKREEVINTVGKKGRVTFRDTDGEIVMECNSDNIASAKISYGPTTSYGTPEYYVNLDFTTAGQTLFTKATEDAVARMETGENYIGIYLDEDVISMPMVSEAIIADSCIISGSFTKDSAQELANVINSGCLPFDLKIKE